MTAARREKIVDKIAKLKLHAESAAKIGSEAEAQAFAAAMQRLMSEHKVLMSEIEHQNLDATDPVVELSTSGWSWQDGKRLDHVQARVEWMEELAGVVCRAHYCRHMILKGSARQWFVGRKTDAEAAIQTFEYLAEAAARLAWSTYCKAYAAYKRGEGPWQKGFQKSFLLGFATRLNERYQEEIARMKAEWANSGTALVRLKDAMTVVNEYMLQRGGKLASAPKKFTGIQNHDAYQKGRAAANDLKLTDSKRVTA